MKRSVCLIATLITSLSIFSAQAAPPKPKPGPAVTTQQISKIEAGQTQEEIISALGNPKATPKWPNGIHSLVYAVSGNGGKLYVDIDNKTNKVLRSVVMPETSPDSAGSDT